MAPGANGTNNSIVLYWIWTVEEGGIYYMKCRAPFSERSSVDCGGGGPAIRSACMLKRQWCGSAYLDQLQRQRLSWVNRRMLSCGDNPSAVGHCALVRGMNALPVIADRPDNDFDTFHWHTDIPPGCSVYSDGSLLDAKFGLGLHALGWAFAVFDDWDNLVAAAYHSMGCGLVMSPPFRPPSCGH